MCLRDCVASFADGREHRIVIPISALYVPGDGFDPHQVAGITFRVERAPTSRNFDFYVDDIKIEAIDKASAHGLCRPAS